MGDLIEREPILKALEEISYALWEVDIPSPTVPEYIEHHRDIQKVMGIVDMWAKKIMAMPSTEKIGKWKRIDYADEVNGYLIPNYECSQCGYWSREGYDYCPSCGSKMEE